MAQQQDGLKNFVSQELRFNQFDGASIDFDQTTALLAVRNSHSSFLKTKEVRLCNKEEERKEHRYILYLSTKSLYSPLQLGWGSGSDGGGVGHGRMRMERGRKKALSTRQTIEFDWTNFPSTLQTEHNNFFLGFNDTESRP